MQQFPQTVMEKEPERETGKQGRSEFATSVFFVDLTDFLEHKISILE